MAVAVAWYADHVKLRDIVEVCAMSVSAVQRAVIRAGVPLRDRPSRRGPSPRSLADLVADARRTASEVAAWRDEVGLSTRSAAACWYLAGRTERATMPRGSVAPIPLLSRRCHVCGAISTNPERCPACHAPR